MSVASRELNLRNLIEASPIACIITDPHLPDNPIVAANAAFVSLTGYDVSEVLGRNCRFLAGAATETAARSLLREAIANHASVVVEMANHRKDGSSFRNAVMIAPLFGDDGALTYFLGSQMEVATGGLGQQKTLATQRIANLSARQVEVLRLMAHGQRHAQIAQALGVTEKTVKMHRGALITKLDCRTSAEAIRIAVEAGL